MQIIIGIVAIVFVAEIIAGIFFVRKQKKQTAKIESLEKENHNLKSDMQFQAEKKQIMQEVFEDAKEQKEAIHTGTDSQRYNAAAAILHNNKRD